MKTKNNVSYETIELLVYGTLYIGNKSCCIWDNLLPGLSYNTPSSVFEACHPKCGIFVSIITYIS